MFMKISISCGEVIQLLSEGFLSDLLLVIFLLCCFVSEYLVGLNPY